MQPLRRQGRLRESVKSYVKLGMAVRAAKARSESTVSNAAFHMNGSYSEQAKNPESKMASQFYPASFVGNLLNITIPLRFLRIMIDLWNGTQNRQTLANSARRIGTVARVCFSGTAFPA